MTATLAGKADLVVVATARHSRVMKRNACGHRPLIGGLTNPYGQKIETVEKTVSY